MRLVSIIIPTYNRAHLIFATLDSVLEQTYTNWECIIVDDNSMDNTRTIIDRYINKDNRFKYLLNNRKKGAQGARNTGLLNSKGTYIQFFDSDNIMNPKLLEKLLSGFDNDQVGVSTCYSNILNDEKEIIGTFTWNSEGDISTKILTGKTYIDYNSALIKADVFKFFELVDENCPAYQEWDTHIRMSTIATYHTIKEFLVDYYRRNDDTISSDKKRGVEGYFYVLSKHKNKFEKNLKSFQKHGMTIYLLCQNIEDKSVQKFYLEKLIELIPRFKLCLLKFKFKEQIKKKLQWFKKLITAF